MSFTDKIDALDMIIEVLKDHERKLDDHERKFDDLIHRLETAIEKMEMK